MPNVTVYIQQILQNLKRMAEQALTYEKALNGFALQKWLGHSFANIQFLSAWKKQPVKVVICMTIIDQLYKNLFLSFYL